MLDGIPLQLGLRVHLWLDSNSRLVDWLERSKRNGSCSTVCGSFFVELAKWEAHQVQPRTLDELGEQIIYTFVAFPLNFLSKSVEAGSSRFQKCAQCSDTCAGI
jgi:hypothetical protein